MKEIFINVDSYNSEGIKTIQGNNNAEIYKICISKSKVRLSLVGKTVKLGYVMAGTAKGDIIEDLNISNAEQGEITFPITNKISKKDGVYTCQLAIYGADGFLEYTATFGLTVQANIFNKIAEEIENSKDLTYIERILEEATNISEELKSNIPVARQLNIDLENQNRILNENMDRANGVNNTLITTTEQSKVVATDAIEKKSQLESSIVKAKEFIDGLDESQNIPQIRLDVTELQNGLKSNQSLEYSGSSITANDTLEGRTEGMSIKGLTLQNLWKPISIQWEPTNKWFNALASSINFDITGKVITVKNITNKAINFQFSKLDNNYDSQVVISSGEIKVINVTSLQKFRGVIGLESVGWENTTENKNKLINGLIVCIGEHSYLPNTYFEGLKSFGEAEQEGDKYKISILSHGKNILNPSLKEVNIYYGYANGLKISQNGTTSYSGIVEPNQEYVVSNNKGQVSNFTFWDKDNNFISGIAVTMKFTTPHNAITLKCACDNDALVQIEKGNISTPYQPYVEDKKDILIKDPLREGDYIFEDNEQVKVYRDAKQYNFTGDESFRILQPKHTNTLSVIVENIIDSKCTVFNNMCRMCNNFSIVDTNARDVEGYNIHLNSVRINILKSKLTTPDIEGFKAWLKVNPTTIVYQLATPVTEVVENCVDIDLDTYQEKTYFNILNSIPGSLDFKVSSNIGSVVQNMAKEVNNIWDVINNLLVPSIVKANGNLAMLKLNNNLN
ncbi:BppU family phage baseplate upper protein [Clostridium perfringens]